MNWIKTLRIPQIEVIDYLNDLFYINIESIKNQLIEFAKLDDEQANELVIKWLIDYLEGARYEILKPNTIYYFRNRTRQSGKRNLSNRRKF